MTTPLVRRTELTVMRDGQEEFMAVVLHRSSVGAYEVSAEYGPAGNRVLISSYPKAETANRMFHILVGNTVKKGFAVRCEDWDNEALPLEFKFSLPFGRRAKADKWLAAFKDVPEVAKARELIAAGFTTLRISTRDAFLPCFLALVDNAFGKLMEPDSKTPPPLTEWIDRSTGRRRELLVQFGMVVPPPRFDFASIAGANTRLALVL